MVLFCQFWALDKPSPHLLLLLGKEQPSPVHHKGLERDEKE